MPVPSCVRACRPFDPVEPLEQAGHLVRRDADPGVADRQPGELRLPARSSTPMPPRSVNLNALDSRLSTIFSHISRST